MDRYYILYKGRPRNVPSEQHPDSDKGDKPEGQPSTDKGQKKWSAERDALIRVPGAAIYSSRDTSPTQQIDDPEGNQPAEADPSRQQGYDQSHADNVGIRGRSNQELQNIAEAYIVAGSHKGLPQIYRNAITQQPFTVQDLAGLISAFQVAVDNGQISPREKINLCKIVRQQSQAGKQKNLEYAQSQAGKQKNLEYAQSQAGKQKRMEYERSEAGKRRRLKYELKQAEKQMGYVNGESIREEFAIRPEEPTGAQSGSRAKFSRTFKNLPLTDEE